MVEVINCAPDPHIGESKTLSFLRNRLEYGYQLQENPPLNRGEIHFSLGFPF